MALFSMEEAPCLSTWFFTVSYFNLALGEVKEIPIVWDDATGEDCGLFMRPVFLTLYSCLALRLSVLREISIA
jgi:hypothetical protein